MLTWQSSCVIANNAQKTQKLFVQGYNLQVHKVIKYKQIPPLLLLCEISGALHLAQPSLMADRQAGRRNTSEFRDFQSWL